LANDDDGKMGELIKGWSVCLMAVLFRDSCYHRICTDPGSTGIRPRSWKVMEMCIAGLTNSFMIDLHDY